MMPAPLFFLPFALTALKAEGADDALVVLGGVVPPQDYAFLEAAGVAAISGPGTDIPLAAAGEVLKLIEKRRVAA